MGQSSHLPVELPIRSLLCRKQPKCGTADPMRMHGVDPRSGLIWEAASRRGSRLHL